MLNEEKILGVKINYGLSWQEILDYIETSMLPDGKPHYISTTNAEFVMDAQKDPTFMQIINNADLSIPDGAGILYALEYKHSLAGMDRRKKLFKLQSFIKGLQTGFNSTVRDTVRNNRRSGVELVEKICEMSSKKGYSVFFLGGRPRDALGRPVTTKEDLSSLAASEILKKYPNLNIIGSTSQYSRNESDDAITCSYIQNCMRKAGISRLDFLFVAYNHIYQEKWIIRNSNSIPVSVSVGVGATLDYIAAYDALAPSIVRKANLEWFYRLLRQPWRFKRVFKAFPLFPINIYIQETSK